MAVLVGFIGIIASYLYSYVIYYLQKSSDCDYRIWDSRMTTASDFTVMIPIQKQVWDRYNSENTYRLRWESDKKEPLEHFKEHFR